MGNSRMCASGVKPNQILHCKIKYDLNYRLWRLALEVELEMRVKVEGMG